MCVHRLYINTTPLLEQELQHLWILLASEGPRDIYVLGVFLIHSGNTNILLVVVNGPPAGVEISILI